MAKSKLSAGRSNIVGRKKRLTRIERNEITQRALFEAAVHVVGEVGYSNAMIVDITTRANVAHGTFYNYFESRQSLFETLLPELGSEMLNFLKEETKECRDEIEREERAFRGFFTFIKTRPEFYRILYEAEVFAPGAFRQHMERVVEGYMRVLQRAMNGGQLARRNVKELEAIVYMLLGVRHYLCMRFARRDSETVSLPEWVVRSYMELVTTNLLQRKVD